MIEIILTKGIPGSGKTTWARKMIDENPGKYVRVNKDDLRKMMDNGRWSKSNEERVQSVRDLAVITALEDGKSVIVDDTNFSPKHEARMRAISQMPDFKGRVKVRIEDFTDVPMEECIKRDLIRPNSVGSKVIKDMFYRYVQPENFKVLEQDRSLAKAIICDLDGTLAHIVDRSPYDGHLCATDKICEPVLEVVKAFHERGYHIIFLSGRQGESIHETMNWLSSNVPFDNWELHMRPVGDKRRDRIVKSEMYEQFVKGKYYIEFVLDDRDQVVSMWREIGLTAFQVSDGNF